MSNTHRWPYDEPHPGAYLQERFLDPIGLDPERLASDLRVDAGKIGLLLAGEGSIDCELALRLGRYFGVAPTFWLGLQAAYDLRHSPPLEEGFPTVDAPGFIVGEVGAVFWEEEEGEELTGEAVIFRIEPEELELLKQAGDLLRSDQEPKGPPTVRSVTYPNGLKALEIDRG